uniref:Putative group v salivary lipocalin n=1 Tax=Rhipicephalus pulchellus TaxID=72859 RepID=L7LTE0_RHIPC
MLPKRALSHRLILAFMCSMCLGNPESGGQGTGNFDGSLDLIKVLNTTEDSWVYWQTYSNAYRVMLAKKNTTILATCIRHHKVHITADQYNFTVYEQLNNTEVEDNRTGRFIYPKNGTTKVPISMTVHEADDEPDYMVTLVYSDPDFQHCNVYSISYLEPNLQDDFPTCEMHIRESRVHDGPTTGCRTFYEQECNRTEYQPYSEKCNSTDVPSNNLLTT